MPERGGSEAILTRRVVRNEGSSGTEPPVYGGFHRITLFHSGTNLHTATHLHAQPNPYAGVDANPSAYSYTQPDRHSHIGADVNARTADGGPLLTVAKKTGNAEIIKILEDAGATEE